VPAAAVARIFAGMAAARAADRVGETISIETPELVEITYSLAGVGSRAVAALVDLALAGLLLLALNLLGLAAWGALAALGLRAGPWLAALASSCSSPPCGATRCSSSGWAMDARPASGCSGCAS
jgi:hypothetical protein